MKKRILALFLASNMLCSAAACSNGTESLDDETTMSTTASTVPEETQAPETLTPTERRMLIPDDLPDKKFDGRSYIIAVDPTKVYEISFEELTGEATNDAVYDRNLRIESRFDVKIEALETATPYDNIKTVVASGTYAYDVAGFVNCLSYTPILAGAVYNWCDIPYINLEKPWYNQLANDPATINGKLYAINGDLSISTLQYTYGMFFNYNIMENYGYSGQDLYDMVFDGKWTVDNMQAITTKIWEDTNGDGIHDRNDIHGYSVFLGLNTTDVWLAAFDLDLIDIHDDGTFEITLDGDLFTASITFPLCK